MAQDTVGRQVTVPSYAGTVANYAPTAHPDNKGALVVSVRPESPADDAGIMPGMRIISVDSVALTDMIVWLWESSDDEIELEVFDPSDQTVATCTLERFCGEDWGIEFDGAVFDGMRTCVNACKFCFMSMLPRDMRDSLYIRDDDYRLSFLQGNFVTLTNMTDSDVRDAVERHLSPMNVSLHAITPDVRRYLMGKNAARGIEVLERLLAEDIEIHAQIVLCPGINDGEELKATLDYVENHPQITSLGIVPLGYTKFQHRFTSSYSDDPSRAKQVIDMVAPYQKRAQQRTGRTLYQLSDEFYLDADVSVPPAESYDGYPQYYDGIGMVRSYIDDAHDLITHCAERLEGIKTWLDAQGKRLAVVTGRSPEAYIRSFVTHESLGGEVFGITNVFFGGNVDVTGLICGCDLLEQLPGDLSGLMLFVPSVMFNADGVTLDGYHQEELAKNLESRGAEVVIASTMPFEMVEALESMRDDQA